MRLGINLDTGGDVQVSQEVLCSGCYIIGRQGMGKSTLLEQIAYQQMNTEKSVFVFDPHGDLVDKIIAGMTERQAKDTYLLDLKDREYPFGLNIDAIPKVV